MTLIGKYNQVIKTPEMIKEEEYLNSVYNSGWKRGWFIGWLITNVIFFVTTLLINIFLK